MHSDEAYMRRCLELAARGLGHTASNPLVGCVIVVDGQIVGEGYHEKFGEGHAEVNAFAQVDPSIDLNNATVYVSLEPCAHFGKTPPCCDLIIQKHVKRVEIAMKDPFPKVDGEGIKRMKEAGIEVEVGLLEEEARALNKRFLTYHLKKRPYIILKWTQTEDGFIGKKGERIQLSNKMSARLSHRWRGEESAILIGPETAISDNPTLNTRLSPGNNPQRILVDRHLRVPKDLNLFSDGNPLWVLNLLENKEEGSLRYIKLPEKNFLSSAMEALYELGVCSLLVEGGAGIHAAFMDENLWDAARVSISSTQLKSGVTAAPWPGISQETLTIDGDCWYFFKNMKN